MGIETKLRLSPRKWARSGRNSPVDCFVVERKFPSVSYIQLNNELLFNRYLNSLANAVLCIRVNVAGSLFDAFDYALFVDGCNLIIG